MLIDTTVKKAQLACEGFMAVSHEKGLDVRLAFSPVLHAMELVLAAMNMSTAMDKSRLAAIHVLSMEDDVDKEHVSRSSLHLRQDGVFVMQTTTTCKGGCHIIDVDRAIMTIEELIRDEIEPCDIVAGLLCFLNDPRRNLHTMASCLRH